MGTGAPARAGANAPIVLVPGFWLGAWAWDEVVAALRELGHDDVTAVTLPGLASPEDDRAAVTFEDHAEAIATAVREAGDRVVLVVHSGAGASGYAASDRVADRIAAMVYVDTGPANGPLDPDFAGVELPLPSFEQLVEDGENLDGISDEQLEAWRRRAVPEPGGAIRGSVPLSNDARKDLPSTVVCTSMTSEQTRQGLEAGWPFLAGLHDLRDVTYLDLPTSHWPMWSRPRELAEIIGAIAAGASTD